MKHQLVIDKLPIKRTIIYRFRIPHTHLSPLSFSQSAAYFAHPLYQLLLRCLPKLLTESTECMQLCKTERCWNTTSSLHVCFSEITILNSACAMVCPPLFIWLSASWLSRPKFMLAYPLHTKLAPGDTQELTKWTHHRGIERLHLHHRITWPSTLQGHRTWRWIAAEQKQLSHLYTRLCSCSI